MVGPNQGLTKSFTAGGTIAKHSIVKFDADDDTVIVGAAATDKLIGVALEAATVGLRVEVQLAGIGEVVLGGTVARGAAVTSGAAGVGVDLAAAATIKTAIGRALASGVTGDVIPVLIGPFEAVTA